MGCIGCGDIEMLGEAQSRVEAFRFAEDLHGPGEIECDVAGACADECRFWGAHDAVVGFIHPERDLAEDVLFAVLWSALFDEFFE